MTTTLQQKKNLISESILALKKELEEMDYKLQEIENLESEIENFKDLLLKLDPELKQIALSEIIGNNQVDINKPEKLEILEAQENNEKVILINGTEIIDDGVDQDEMIYHIKKTETKISRQYKEYSEDQLEKEALEILTPPAPLEKLAHLKKETSPPPALKPEIFFEEKGKLLVTISNNSYLEVKAKLKKDAQTVIDTVEIFISLGTIQDLTKDGTEPLKYQGIFKISEIEIFNSKREGILKSISQGLTSDIVVNPMGLMSDDPDLFFDEDASPKQQESENVIKVHNFEITQKGKLFTVCSHGCRTTKEISDWLKLNPPKEFFFELHGKNLQFIGKVEVTSIYDVSNIIEVFLQSTNEQPESKIVTTDDEPAGGNLIKETEEDDIYEKIRAELFSSDADELDFDLEGFVKLHDHLTKNLSFSETLECYKKLGHSSVATFGLLSECRKLIKILDDYLITITKSKTYDFVAVMKEIDQEIKRLNWGADQAKKYLIDNYGKVSRQLLRDDQLLNLLTDLKNQ